MAIKFSKTFLLRKLHQLTGIVPLGLFFFGHMYTNSAAMGGVKNFNDHVQGIHDIPYLLFIEIFGIFLPLIFHSVYGIFISMEARPNPYFGTGLAIHRYVALCTGCHHVAFIPEPVVEENRPGRLTAALRSLFTRAA